MSGAARATELLTIDDVSKLLKVPVKTIRQWVYKARIPNAKLNGVVRFNRAAIEAWIEQATRADG